MIFFQLYVCFLGYPRTFKLVNQCWPQIFLVKYTHRMWGNQNFQKKFLIPSLAQSPSKFKYIRHYIPYSAFRPSFKKVCFSDVMHCQKSIFEIKMMVKIGVIFMLFLNPTCHIRVMS